MNRQNSFIGVASLLYEVKPRSGFSPEKSDAIKRHMREEADLTPEEQQAILEFLKSGN